jgi:RHS repeat-associated protein
VVASGTPSNPLPEPPSPGTTSIWTVDYQIPVSGSELPTLTKTEVEKWGQKDDPVEGEGMAVFPPDKPMGWPAKEYKRAAITYYDEEDRAVSTYSPSGGISTTEYNEFNDVVRTLSPDNRVAALKEGSKSAEVAKLLSSESKYNGETKAEREKEEKEPGGSAPGTRLLESLGPQHAVRLVHGKTKENQEVQARNNTVYSYDEGEPSTGGPYSLVTKVTQGAQVNGEADRDVRTVTTSYSGQNNLGWKLRKPTSVTTEPTGLDLTSSTTYNESTGSVVETQTPGANGEAASELKSFSKFGGSGSGSGQLEKPGGVAVDGSGDVWVADTGHGRVQEFNSKGEFVHEFNATARAIAVSAAGDVYVAGSNKIEVYNLKSEFIRSFGSAGKGEGQFEELVGLAVDGEGHVWALEEGIKELKWVPRVEEFTAEGVFMKQFGAEGKENGQLNEPRGIAVDSKGNVWVSDTGNDRVEEFKSSGEFVRTFGKEGSGNGEFKKPVGLAFDSEGDLWVADSANDRVQRFTDEGSYLSQDGKIGNENGQFNNPEGIATSSGSVWVADINNNRIQTWTPEHRFVDDVKTIYYTAKEEAAVATCRNHPEWANLPCQTEPAAQPAKGDPLPVTTISSYSILDEPEITTATAGSSTRTTTMTYDGAGRLLTSEATSTEGKSLPKVTDKYSETTGQLIEQSTGSGSEAKTIKSTYNTLGQLTSYTDANGGMTTYEYEGEGSYKGEKELDGRLKFMDDGKGTQAYTYEETTGALSKLVDTQGTNVLTFTASYDVEGNMTSEAYPNGMAANFSHGATGETTGLSYEKTTHCTEKCAWFSESLIPSIHDQTLEDVSSLATDSYAYDEAGRLTQVHETPAGEYCKTRIYAYDEESDRTSLTSREPNSKKECATEGGTVEKHSYDEADRLTDTGITYNNFGDITKLPSADAGGGELQSTYYLDGQLAEQKQGEQTIGYQLDPAGRPSETIDTGTVNSTYQSHYAGPGSSPSWTVEPVSGHWTRYVQGIGGLAAIETGTSEPVLQLTDLHGDVVARASLSETATKLLSSERSTEYGVPTTSKPEKYSWLGGDLLPTELPSGVVAMGARSYVPKIGRFLQPDPMPGGTDNPYAYTNGNPVNETDLTGDYVENDYLQGFWAGQNQKAIEAEAAREQAAREAAEEAARIAAAIAAMDAKIAAEQAAINAQDLWDAESAEVFASYMANLPAQEAESAAAAAAEEGGGGGGGGNGGGLTAKAASAACPPQYKGCSPSRHRQNPCEEEVRTAHECAEVDPKGNPGKPEQCVSIAFVGGLFGPAGSLAAGYACDKLDPN